MAQPTPEMLQQALDLSSRPRPERSADEERFLRQFWDEFLQPLPDEDPSRLAVRLFGELGTIRVRLVNQGYESHYTFVPPPPEPRHPPSDDDPPRQRQKRQRREKRTVEAEEEPRRLSGARLSAAGDVLGTLLDTGQRLTDEQIGAFLSGREYAFDWERRIRRLAAVVSALALGVAVLLGSWAVWQAKSAAEHQGTAVQQWQQQVGDFSDRLATQP